MNSVSMKTASESRHIVSLLISKSGKSDINNNLGVSAAALSSGKVPANGAAAVGPKTGQVYQMSTKKGAKPLGHRGFAFFHFLGVYQMSTKLTF